MLPRTAIPKATADAIMAHPIAYGFAQILAIVWLMAAGYVAVKVIEDIRERFSAFAKVRRQRQFELHKAKTKLRLKRVPESVIEVELMRRRIERNLGAMKKDPLLLGSVMKDIKQLEKLKMGAEFDVTLGRVRSSCFGSPSCRHEAER